MVRVGQCLIVQILNVGRELQEVDDVIGGDSHVVFEAGEEIVKRQLVPQHESMLSTQRVIPRLQTLIRLRSLVVGIRIVQRNRVLPNLQPHVLRQCVLYHFPSIVLEAREAQHEVDVDLPPAFGHGGDGIDELGEHHVFEAIVTPLRATGPLVVLHEGRRYQEDTQSFFSGGEGRRTGGEGEGAGHVAEPAIVDDGGIVFFLEASPPPSAAAAILCGGYFVDSVRVAAGDQMERADADDGGGKEEDDDRLHAEVHE
mmetsp:Transcript_53702/g.114058  ORF Transcript_53702/g.114058 Transcript_53702/m.114058 type:complete len:256 (+) Transcript_53702:1319-2086(+)